MKLNDTDATVRELANWESFSLGNLQSPSLIQQRVPHNGRGKNISVKGDPVKKATDKSLHQKSASLT